MGWGSWRALDIPGEWEPLGGEGKGLRRVLGTHGRGEVHGQGAEGSGCPRGHRRSLVPSSPWPRPGTPGAARRRSGASPRRTRIPWTPGSRGPAAWSSTGSCRSVWRSGRTGGSARRRSELSAPAWPGGSSGSAGPARPGPRTDTPGSPTATALRPLFGFISIQLLGNTTWNCWEIKSGVCHSSASSVPAGELQVGRGGWSGGYSIELCHGRVRLDMRNFFMARGFKHWKGLLREV